jgi:hypothetical protein
MSVPQLLLLALCLSFVAAGIAYVLIRLGKD